MAEFLTGLDLSNRIREVLQGKNLKCAVAFWGVNTGSLKDFKNAKIICDIHSGGTNPAVLEALWEQSIKKENIRYRENLHAKVYWSENGVIIGSANASSSGLGTFEKDPSNLEAGVFHKPNFSVWKSVEKWFDGEFQNSHCVDQRVLQICKERWSSKEKQGMFRGEIEEESKKQIAAAQEEGSLFKMLCANPLAFERVSFAFTTCNVSKAREVEIKNKCIEKTTLKEENFLPLIPWNGWDLHSVEGVSNLIEFYKPRSRVKIIAHSVVYTDKNKQEQEASLLTRVESWRDWMKEGILPHGTPFLENVLERDLRKIEKFFEETEEWHS
ncbi:hypothetical protein FAI41_06490 [Acetobacteraceae bacterium]|nr:hypothetical protein FAI41_06490 [Acetobacteraceae bacterium]